MSNFRIGIAADHGGYALKIDLIAWMQAEGYELEDFGAYAFEPADDYPDFVVPLARAVAAGKVQKGIASAAAASGPPLPPTRSWEPAPPWSWTITPPTKGSNTTT